ncbi:MAG: extracellular solute-binding protein [Gemmataceae bacterium]|nr:extracellular solute-binding protein [Gemmataceae bacterium]
MQRKTRINTVIFSSALKTPRFFAAAATVGLVFLVHFLTAGCAPPPNVSGPAPRYAGLILRVAAPKDSTLSDILKRHGTYWERLSGARIERVAPDSACDVILFRPWETGRLVSQLAPIDVAALRSVESYEYSLLLRQQVEHTLDWGGRTYALPVVGESLVMIFRSDLLGDPKHSEHLPVRMRARSNRAGRPVGPTTWQELAAVAEYFAQQSDWGPGNAAAVPRPTLPPLPEDDDELDREFHALAASFVRPMTNSERASSLSERMRTALFFNYQFDADTGEAMIDMPGFVAALAMMQRLQALRGPSTGEKPIEAFRRGQAIFAFATLFEVQSLQAADSPVRGRFGVGRIPGSEENYDPDSRKLKASPEVDGNTVPYLAHGGWLGGIRHDSDQSSLALDFLAFLTSPRVSLEIVAEPRWGAGPTRGSHLDSRSIWHNYDLDPAVTNQLIDSMDAACRSSALNPVFRLRVKDEDRFKRAFCQELRKVLADRSDAREALKRVRSEWDQIITDREAFRREYRESLGLK